MTLVHCSGPEAVEARMYDLGGETSRPSLAEAREDDKLTRAEQEAVADALRAIRSDPVMQAVLHYRGPR